jgi:Sulfatase
VANSEKRSAYVAVWLHKRNHKKDRIKMRTKHLLQQQELPKTVRKTQSLFVAGLSAGVAMLALAAVASSAQAQEEKRPNVVMLMTDDTGWGDFGAYGGGANLGHPTPNVDRVAQEGAVFTSWYGQASCTAGRASLLPGASPSVRLSRSWLCLAIRTD